MILYFYIKPFIWESQRPSRCHLGLAFFNWLPFVSFCKETFLVGVVSSLSLHLGMHSQRAKGTERFLNRSKKWPVVTFSKQPREEDGWQRWLSTLQVEQLWHSRLSDSPEGTQWRLCHCWKQKYDNIYQTVSMAAVFLLGHPTLLSLVLSDWQSLRNGILGHVRKRFQCQGGE